MQFPRRRQHLISSSAYANIFREVIPANNLRRVDQKLRRSRNVVPIRPTGRMQQMITPDDRRVRIRKDWERVPAFASQIARNFRRVHADRHRLYARRLEFRQSFLHAS